MASVVKCFAIDGIDGYPVDIEIKTLEGQPMISIIGLGDQAVKEASERVQAAIDETGYIFPKKRVIISLAPSDKKKSGSHFDLAMAIGVLQQNEDMAVKNISEYGFIGELSLDGRLRACHGRGLWQNWRWRIQKNRLQLSVGWPRELIPMHIRPV